MGGVTVCERTFALGQNRFRLDARGNWSVLPWGWWPTGSNPRYGWSSVEASKVPKEVLEKANGY